MKLRRALIGCLIGFMLLGGVRLFIVRGENETDLQSNLLDRDYEREAKALGNSKDYNTASHIELENKYAQRWDRELNAIYKKLLIELEPEEKALLKASQRGWLQYHEKEGEFYYRTFYYRKSGPILGSLGRIEAITRYKERIRARALELMEYYSDLDKGVVFEYKKKK